MSPPIKITIPLLLKTWFTGISIYLIRNTSQYFKFKLHNEGLLYLILGVGILAINKVILPLMNNDTKGTEMTREESELMKEYLRCRRKGEMLGDWLVRIEREEDEKLVMMKKMGGRKGRLVGNGGMKVR